MYLAIIAIVKHSILTSFSMLNYHTPRQVYTGFGVGAGCAVAWFIATGLARHIGVFDWLLELAPLRWLRMRDLLLNEDLVDAGWERWELRRQRRGLATPGGIQQTKKHR